MAQLNQEELQELRHLIGMEQVVAKQLGTYSQQCKDPQLLSSLQEAALKADQHAKTLFGFLQS